MKILHLNTYDFGGGAAIAALRLHTALHGQGVDSRLAVLEKSGDDPSVFLLWRRFSSHITRLLAVGLERKVTRLCYNFPEHAGYTSFALAPTLNHKRINALSKDILHLHWINDRLLTPYSLARLRGPIIWTLHDTFGFTGGCHFTSTGCVRYLGRCGRCPELGSSWEVDLSRLHWTWKRRAVKTIEPVLVCPSRELARKAQASMMLQGLRIEVIPNCLDTRVFRPISKEHARQLLGLPEHGVLVLFGAASAVSDYNKGFDLLEKALLRLRTLLPDQPLSAVVFGSSGAETIFPTCFLGRLHDPLSLVLAYSAADVFVCPSRQENLPNTVMEALACGTPVAAFSVGGIPDMVDDGVTGRLAEPENPDSLAHAIADILGDKEKAERMARAARDKVVREYSQTVVAKRYLALYEETLAGARLQ